MSRQQGRVRVVEHGTMHHVSSKKKIQDEPNRSGSSSRRHNMDGMHAQDLLRMKAT